ncbi:uncharacterized protein LOC121369621 isoform X2 [Gigantopelta aegis]|uniref:uncharacterized protein LOC121369621 isoform X2 n=1 Tax=Gigantopelta aegis TaxID=1735272 RepID=UPI001B8893D6|nr:uncharacterized protein LOC121369621 isoform X2 [Gigantopelta aegis]
MEEGGKKKFLYVGPKSKETENNDKWQFIPRAGTPPFQTPAIDLDSVWSIKRNVLVGNAQHDRLTLNAKKNYYSRHGGIKTDNKTTSTSNEGSASSKGSYQAWGSRRGFSYSTYSQTNSDTDIDSQVSDSSSPRQRGQSHRPLDPHDF